METITRISDMTTIANNMIETTIIIREIIDKTRIITITTVMTIIIHHPALMGIEIVILITDT